MVDFCDSCGTIIIGKKGDKVECPSCGKTQKTQSSVKLTEKVKKKKEQEIVDTNSAAEIHPTTEAECPQCGAKEAYYWTKQTRAGDEPETQFFKCTECAHQWRDYR